MPKAVQGSCRCHAQIFGTHLAFGFDDEPLFELESPLHEASASARAVTATRAAHSFTLKHNIHWSDGKLLTNCDVEL